MLYRAHNGLVVGSSPTGPTKYSGRLRLPHSDASNRISNVIVIWRFLGCV